MIGDRQNHVYDECKLRASCPVPLHAELAQAGHATFADALAAARTEAERA